ncbi:MAG: winged helix-turn-helix domain-containing protein [Pyrinomonadaceae bacterium]|nr:winged helix-turn-helix domain-containing protein [Pyrinomonadaceae bacterium]
MPLQTNNIYEFKDFRLDFTEKTLQGRNGVIPLTPKVFETLCVLVENAGHLIEKDELMQKLWQDRFVEESNLTFNIKMLRKALGDNAHKPRFIETVQSRGYRFIAKVSEVNGQAAAPLVPKGGPSAIEKAAVVLPSAKPKRPARVILFTVGFATAAILIFQLSFNFRSNSADSSNQIRSIAVLPVIPLTAENRDSSYELGIADSLIFKLGSAKGLIVRSFSATSQYANIGQDPIAAGREQQVDYVLASKYQIADGKIRITSQLINVQSGQVEGSFKTEQQNSTIFAIQDAVAANIGGPILKKLDRKSSDLAEKRYTTNEEAYRLYIQGTVLAEKRGKGDVTKVADLFEQAIRLDPNFALAYAELASVHIRALNGGGRRATEAYIKAKAAIEKALSIDETLAEAHTYLGIIKTNYEWDFAGAELEHKRAVELNPNSSTAHCMYALLLGTLGRFDEAIPEMKTAIDLEPASAGIHHSYGWLLFQARRYDEAIAEEQLVVEMDPKKIMAYNVLSNSYGMKGDDERSFEAFLQLQVLRGDKQEETDELRAIYSRAGWRGVSERQLEKEKEAERKGNPHYGNLAGISIELGQNEQAISYLEKAVDQNRFTLITLRVNPRYDPLRGDPRFHDLMKRVGLN